MIGAHLAEVFAYIPKPIKKRIVAVCEQKKGLSISKIVGSCLEACIDDLEKQVGIKPTPKQATRNKRTLDA
ncbi:MAG: hypothetical protein V4563_14365 [Pseudomonadota bacterium]